MTRTLLIIGGAIALCACGIGDAQPRLRTAVDAKRAEMNSCYTTALSRDESIGGEVEATLHVEGSTGHLAQVEFGEGQVTDPQLRSCLSNVLQSVTLSDAPKKKLEVSYTFRLTASD